MADIMKETRTMRTRAFVVMAMLLALTACGQGPGDAARAAMEAAGRGQTAEALQRVDPEIKTTAGIFIAPMLQDKARKAQAKGGVTSVMVEKVDQNDADHATVTTVTHFGDGSTQTDSGKVRRVDGKWYITI
jgi:predicted small lipoprotein YifL